MTDARSRFVEAMQHMLDGSDREKRWTVTEPMTTQAKCDRCGTCCPMVLWHEKYGPEPDFNEGWVAAFQACGTMARFMVEHEANRLREQANNHLFNISENLLTLVNRR